MLLIATAFVFSCKHQVAVPEKSNGGDTTGNNNGGSNDSTGSSLICFEGEVLPIFQSSCAKSGCHDAVSHEEGYILTSYSNIMRKGIKPGNPAESELFEKIVSGEMPPAGNPKLTNEQVNTIKQWIVEGAQNTTNCNSCDTSVFTYSGAVKKILQTNCVACHSATLANGGVDLSSYNGVRVVALNGKLDGTITHAPGFVAMPQGGNMLSDCNIIQIEKWIAAGALNN